MASSDVTLLTGTVDTPLESAVEGAQVFSMSSQPHANAIVNAVIGGWYEKTGRPEPDFESALGSYMDEKVTLVLHGSNMLGSTALLAREGRVFVGQRGIGVMPKGNRRNGYLVDPKHTLDLLPGYAAAEAKRLTDETRSQYPLLDKLTQERLEQLPPYEPSGDIHLCVFGTWDTPEGRTTDAIWLIGAYNKESDIVDNSVLLIRPEYGVSESGSVYGEQLLRANVGVVVGMPGGKGAPFPGMKFRDAVSLTNLDYEEAAATVFGLVAAAS
jgi:hypothetical protein